MFETIVQADTLPRAYHGALLKLYEYGKIEPCPDYNTTQKEISMTLVVNNPLAEPMISRMFSGGYYELEQYRQEMLDGILDFEIENGKWAYTYHRRMEKQIPFIVKELSRNPFSRRAVIDIRDWEKDAQSNDPACLQHIQYFIRDNKLHCKVLFRSNDACKATFMNAFALIMLQERIANMLGVEVGTYTHRANSFHCYEKDFNLLEGYVKRIKSGDALTYDYIGDFKELMDSCKPMIAEKVKELRERAIATKEDVSWYYCKSCRKAFDNPHLTKGRCPMCGEWMIPLNDAFENDLL